MSFPKLGKFEVVGVLGRGAMGLVYKARDPDIGRFVAIKTVKPEIKFDPEKLEVAKRRFKQEFRSVGKVLHPNIVTIFDAGCFEDDMPYIIMEYLRGLRFTQFVKDNVKLSAEDYLHLLGQIASAVDYAHSQSVFHQDIKPGNVIVTRGSVPKLVDFGVSQRGSKSQVVKRKEVVGTPSYMSPEQLRGLDYSGSSDRFAMSVLAYELLTGERPFAGASVNEITSNILTEEPSIFPKRNDTEIEGLREVFKVSLDKNASNRYQTCEYFMKCLERKIYELPSYIKDQLFSDDKHLNRDYRPSADTKSMEVFSSRPHLDHDTYRLGSITPKRPEVAGRLIGTGLAVFVSAALAWFVLQ